MCRARKRCRRNAAMPRRSHRTETKAIIQPIRGPDIDNWKVSRGTSHKKLNNLSSRLWLTLSIKVSVSFAFHGRRKSFHINAKRPLRLKRAFCNRFVFRTASATRFWKARRVRQQPFQSSPCRNNILRPEPGCKHANSPARNVSGSSSAPALHQ